MPEESELSLGKTKEQNLLCISSLCTHRLLEVELVADTGHSSDGVCAWLGALAKLREIDVHLMSRTPCMGDHGDSGCGGQRSGM